MNIQFRKVVQQQIKGEVKDFIPLFLQFIRETDNERITKVG